MSFYRKNSQKVTKADTERWHAEQRLAQRFGLPKEYVSYARKAIKTGRSEFIKAQSNRVTHHKVTLAGRTTIVVWDKLRKQVITFLTEEMCNEALSSEVPCPEMAARRGLPASS